MARFHGTNGSDILPYLPLGPVLALGNDEVYGYDGDDVLIGWTGNDVLVGGRGNDVLIGGLLNVQGGIGTVELSGNDTASYEGSYAAVSVDLSDFSLINLDIAGLELALTGASVGEGGDAEGDILVGITNLVGSDFSDTLIGNQNSNRLIGGSGADYLDGRAGADIMIGGVSSDTYIVDNAEDRVIELAGEGDADRVVTSVSYALSSTAEIEFFNAADPASTAAINLVGNDFRQVMVGNAGDNILNGGGGADVMAGREGDDAYIVDNAGDVIRETDGNGNDRLSTSVDYVLAGGVSIEDMSVSNRDGTDAVDLTGNSFAQRITGNAGDNIINGRGGKDFLIGLGGDDVFVFDRPLIPNNVDRIWDFGDGDDSIWLYDEVFSTLDLGALDAGAFRIGFSAADADDRIIYDYTTGQLFYDRDGVGGAGQIQFATLATDLTVTADDFFVI